MTCAHSSRSWRDDTAAGSNVTQALPVPQVVNRLAARVLPMTDVRQPDLGFATGCTIRATCFFIACATAE